MSVSGFRLHRLRSLTFAWLALIASTALQAASPPTLTRAFPAGGERGQQVEISLSGANLGGLTAAWLSERKIVAEVVESKDDKSARLRLSIPTDVELGDYDLRVLAAGGASNRMRIVVGDLPEVTEAEPNSQFEQAQPIPKLPATINGEITKEDQDFFRFSAKAGQTFVFEICGRRLHPFLRFDNRVGWFDPCVTLHDAKGRELRFADDFRDDPDPVMIHRFEKDGDYVVAVRDTMYRGRAECVYRLRFGELPYITSVFPLGWHRHSYARVQLFGANVPAETTFTIPAAAAPLHSVRVSANGRESNAVPFAVDDVSEVFEIEPNDELKQAQLLIAPAVLNGRIDRPGDQDCALIRGAKGERLIVEVAAHRFGSPLDSLVQILTPDGKQLASNDDAEGVPTQLHRADARLDFTLPADGDYIVRLRDFLNHGGEEFAYRVLISPPSPGFELTVTPDNPRLDRGGSCTLTLATKRLDGFDGAVQVTFQNLPPGIVATPIRIEKGQDKTIATLTATGDAPLGNFASPLIVAGQAEGASSPAVQAATAIEHLEYVNNKYEDIPVREPVLALSPAVAPFQLSVASGETNITQTGKVEWKVSAQRRPGVTGPISLTVQGLPKNVTARTATIPADKTETTVVVSADGNAPLGSFVCAVEGKLTIDKQTFIQPAPAVTFAVIKK